MESQVKKIKILDYLKKKSDIKFFDITFSIFPEINWNTLPFFLLQYLKQAKKVSMSTLIPISPPAHDCGYLGV